MESLRLLHPDVWATKRSSFPIALRMGPISSIPIALTGPACTASHCVMGYSVLAPCQLGVHVVIREMGLPAGMTCGSLVACVYHPTLE